MRILLAEDDTMLGSGIERGLRMAGFTLDWVRNGNSAQTALRTQPYDVVLLDIGLPGKDGLELLQWMRQEDLGVAVLVVSARDSVSDRIAGLNLGADDYLPKPFDLDELIARIHAVGRRRSGRSQPEMRLGPLQLNPLRREALLDNLPLSLSAREYDILLALMERPGTVLSRAQLENRLYGWEDEVASNTIEVHLHHLRRKLGIAWIKNVRGVGYKLVNPQ
jgi:two-component system response regulator QseB